MAPPSEYKDRFEAAMKAAGMDAHAMAKALGVSYQAIMKVRNGTTKMLRADHNAVAAMSAGVCPDWLATGKGEMRQSAAAAITLAQALGQALLAISRLTPGQWAMVRARLDDLPSHPEACEDAAADIFAILVREPGKRLRVG